MTHGDNNVNASNGALRSFMTNNVVVWILSATLVFLFATLAGCFIVLRRDDALDYACIVLGSASAIMAVLPVFLPKWRKSLCTVSALLLVAGVFCFLAKYKEYPFPIAIGFISICVLMLVTLIRVAYKSRGLAGMAYDAHFTLMIFIDVILVSYAVLFALKNSACLFVNTTELCHIWYWW